MKRSLVTLALALAACAGTQTPDSSKPVLAVFEIKVRQLKLRRAVRSTLHGHATRMMDGSGLYNVVPREKLQEKLRRRRRRSERSCYNLRCQSKLGKRLLNADKSLAIQITKNLASRCDVIAYQFDLETQTADQSARTRCDCSEEQLIHALNQVLCHILSKVGGDAEAREETSEGGGKIPPPPRATPERACIVQADFLWVDRKLETFAKTRIRGSGRRQAAQERRMAERLLELKRDYDRIVRRGEPRWMVAALCRTGTLYEQLAQTMVLTPDEAKVPRAVRRLGKEEVEAYKRQQEEAQQKRAAPFRKKAKEIYEQCLAKAKEHDVSSKYTDEAKKRLDQLNKAEE
jgi:hypothetical protein